MRAISIAALAFCFIAVSSLAQQAADHHPSVDELLAKLHSEDWIVRSDALDELRADPAALRMPKVQSTLLDLLDKENQEIDTPVREAQKSANQNTGESGGEEGFGEYWSWLADTVASFANWHDPRQVCILISAATLRDAPTAKETASRMKVAMPCLLQRSKSDLGINREIAIPMLVEALAKSKGVLDSGTVQSARQIILNALHDPNDGIRASTVDALGKFGDPDMIPTLTDVARSDPASEPSSDGKGPWFPIRKAAIEAIAEIQQRAPQE